MSTSARGSGRLDERLDVAVMVAAVSVPRGTVLSPATSLVALRATLFSVAAGMVAGLAPTGERLAQAALAWTGTSIAVRRPVVEEPLKAVSSCICCNGKVGFVVDAAIHGFGSAPASRPRELYYVQATPKRRSDLGRAGVRHGVMHGGASPSWRWSSKALQNRSDAFNSPGLRLCVA